jgi:hypothetical protein
MAIETGAPAFATGVSDLSDLSDLRDPDAGAE